jgi:thymidylate synthase (FAD)
MKILNGDEYFKILTPIDFIKQQLFIIEEAGRTCYQPQQQEITQDSAERFITMIIKIGHESVIEHSILTVKLYNVSRGLTHELVRHRLGSFSQESTRYVDYARKDDANPDLDKFEIKIVIPPHKSASEMIELGDGTSISVNDIGVQIEKYYRALRKQGWAPEDARQFLPTGLKAEITATFNFRQWRHIFKERTTKFAHWEIRIVFVKLLEEFKKIIPVVFSDFVPDEPDQNGHPCYKKI